MSKSLLPGLLTLLLGSGCSLIPALPEKQPPIPAAWNEVKGLEKAEPLPADAATPQLPWRQFYRHPVWQELIETALRHNRDLQAAVARMGQAKALLGISTAARLPSVQANLLHQENRTPAELAQSGKATVSSRDDLQLALPAFELDFWGRLNALQQEAKATFLANEAAVQAVRTLLIAQVAEAWINWREAAERSLLARQRLDVQQTLQQLVADRQQAGIATAQSHWQAVLATQGAQAELAESQRQEGAAHHALQLLTGHNWDAERHWPLLEEVVLSDTLPIDLPAQTLAARPDVRAAEYRLQAANAHIGAARAAFWPRITLTSSLGLASAGLQGLFAGGASAWSFLPSLELPIFDAGRRAFAQEAAEAEQRALLAEYEKVIQQAFREAADGLQARNVLRQQLQALQNSQQAQLARLQLLQERFTVGVDSKLELLNQQLALYSSEQQLRSAERQLLVNQAMLYKALGGGVN
ncbi:MAG: efflux transporter outer membrane subunit [Magnetococcales bacterium]|nr:efflux transporter outer membrane subunit [Magnetococcales bacterium]